MLLLFQIPRSWSLKKYIVILFPSKSANNFLLILFSTIYEPWICYSTAFHPKCVLLLFESSKQKAPGATTFKEDIKAKKKTPNPTKTKPNLKKPKKKYNKDIFSYSD